MKGNLPEQCTCSFAADGSTNEVDHWCPLHGDCIGPDCRRYLMIGMRPEAAAKVTQEQLQEPHGHNVHCFREGWEAGQAEMRAENEQLPTRCYRCQRKAVNAMESGVGNELIAFCDRHEPLVCKLKRFEREHPVAHHMLSGEWVFTFWRAQLLPVKAIWRAVRRGR